MARAPRRTKFDFSKTSNYLELSQVLKTHNITMSSLIRTALDTLLVDFPLLRDCYNDNPLRSPIVSRAKLREVERALQEEIQQLRLQRSIRRLQNFSWYQKGQPSPKFQKIRQMLD